MMFEENPGPQEYVLIGNDDTTVECEINGDILRTNEGIPFGIVFIIHDIREKKKLQSQLFQSQKMEAIGRLAGGVAHDFNNMLNVILGYATILKRDIAPKTPSERKINAIINAAEQSASLTKQLLAFARKQVIHPVVINPNEELNHLHKMLDRLIGEDVKLVVRQEEKVWNIKIDPTQLTQIVTNLVTNARDAINNVGVISIEVHNLVVKEPTAAEQGEIPVGEYVLLSVSDSGSGIEKEILPQIFEPFFTTKPKDKGTGLGLSTVFGIVKQNNGFITVSSEPDKGTTFHLYFPHDIGEKSAATKKEEELALEGTETIMIVEDEQELLKMCVSVLQEKGYNVLSAGAPLAAKKLYDRFEGSIDLLISDVVMPGMNGKELKEWIEEKQPSIKTLFISGYTSDIVAERGILEEGVNFLQKPFTPHALIRLVRVILNKK
jgi:signal transduction histidine kinase